MIVRFSWQTPDKVQKGTSMLIPIDIGFTGAETSVEPDMMCLRPVRFVFSSSVREKGCRWTSNVFRIVCLAFLWNSSLLIMDDLNKLSTNESIISALDLIVGATKTIALDLVDDLEQCRSWSNQKSKKKRGIRGIEPRTSRTQSENYTIKPNPLDECFESFS